ncbi:hypothetical protein [Bradyrhizobium elkanii]|uniref:hypothetical protein n=1 Tax=Bradyrhizobium elkanii TaxID=29448 RepID=UPI00272CB1AB|nr:hypothetical protein [Bradyrhizobium elkanii]WLA80311.1 hypothetical protein QNJ99_33740 [Bradyrhizobium elkanii]
MPKAKVTTPDDLFMALAKRAAPRSQAEWREASTALRECRRANRSPWARTASIRCGSLHRRLDLWGDGPIGYYNGPSPVSWIDMIGFYRRRYMEGDTAQRLEHARQFAARSREDGPIALP